MVAEGAGRVRVETAAAGSRLDRFLAAHLNLPRNQVQQWLRAGRVRIGGRAAKASHPVAAGEVVEWEPLERPAGAEVEPEQGDLAVVWQDDDLVVLDKPASLAVHPGAGRPAGTLVNRLVGRFPEVAGVGGRGRPGIVHRLDLDTTGLLVVARSDRAYRELSAAFAERRVDKRYLGIAYGTPREAAGRIDRPIARHRGDRKKMAVAADGRPAVTSYRVLASAAGISLLELDLETGRTHQIRVHLKAIGHPLVGDPTYGEARWKALPPPSRPALRDFPRPALHAWRLAFDHPATGTRLALEAPPPADLVELWQKATGQPLPIEKREER